MGNCFGTGTQSQAQAQEPQQERRVSFTVIASPLPEHLAAGVEEKQQQQQQQDRCKCGKTGELFCISNNSSVESFREYFYCRSCGETWAPKGPKDPSKPHA